MGFIESAKTATSRSFNSLHAVTLRDSSVAAAFVWISAYYTVLASQLEAVFVWQSS